MTPVLDQHIRLGWQVIKALRANHWIPVDQVSSERVSDDIQQAFSSSVRPQVFPVAYYFMRVDTDSKVLVIAEPITENATGLPSYRKARLKLFNAGLCSQTTLADHQAALTWQRSCTLSQLVSSAAPVYIGQAFNRRRFNGDHARTVTALGEFCSW